jgi:hypothetical protein
MTPRAILIVCLTAIIALSVLLPAGFSALADDDGGVSDLSLYERASELTREFATALAPGSGVERMYMLETTEGGSDNLLVAGNAGALLGYADIMSDDTGIVGWLMNSYTTASATITYDQLMHVVGDGSDNALQAAMHNPFFQYAGYGEILTDMGLISTIRPGLSGAINFVVTGMVAIVYLLANTAPFLFRGALMILTTLNPFRLFETAMNGTASADLGILSGVAEYVGSMYQAVQNFSIVFLFPTLLAATAFGILVFNKGSGMKRFARYGLRVFMLFAGLPLIGATYTGLLNDLDSKVSVGSEYADYLILSSYVDFEDWVKYSRLAPPEDIGIKHPRFNDNEERTISNRELILDINGSRANSDRAYRLKDRYSATSDIGEIFTEGGSKRDADSRKISNAQKSSFSDVMSLLTRHMTSATYTSSDYNGEVAGQIQRIRSQDSSDENDENIVKMFSLSASDSRTWIDRLNVFSDEPDWMQAIHWNGESGEGKKEGDDKRNSAKGLFTEGNALNETFQFGKYRMNIYNTGDLRYDQSKGYVTRGMPSVMESKTAPIGETRGETVGGLSPIAMYNFLNTSFSNTGLTVYSPQRSASDLSRDAYAAVTFGGSGVSAFTRWVENLTVMLSLAALSIAYGLMMVNVAIKSLPRILSSVFGTALGSIAFTTKLLISTSVLIIQVVGMIFLYSLSESIIMSMLLNFNSLVDMGSNYFSGAGLLLDFLGSFLVIVITAGTTFFMIKNVKVFKELMEEVVSSSINRMMSTLDTSTGGKGLDLSKMSNGRVGGDGKLTDAARQADSGGLIGGAAGLLGAAHDLESRREAIDRERDTDENPTPQRTFKEKAKARLDTAKDLAKAKGSDVAKSGLGIDGKAYDREMGAKDATLQSMRYNNAKNNSDDNDNNDDLNGDNATNLNGSKDKEGLGSLVPGNEAVAGENNEVLTQDENGDIISGDKGAKPTSALHGVRMSGDGDQDKHEGPNVNVNTIDKDKNGLSGKAPTASDSEGSKTDVDSDATPSNKTGKPLTNANNTAKSDAKNKDNQTVKNNSKYEGKMKNQNPTQSPKRGSGKTRRVTPKANSQAAQPRPDRTNRHANGGQGVPQRQSNSLNKSHAILTASGVTNYDDYRKQITKHRSDLKSNQSQLNQAKHRLAALHASNRPSQIIEQAENQVTTLYNNVKSSEAKVQRLKDNAQGLLKNGHFQPNVASRPIRRNGTEVINQMRDLSLSQTMYDKFAQQAQGGAELEQMKSLGNSLSKMKQDLVRCGIREDAIKDNASIIRSAKLMEQSWESFVNGKGLDNKGK